MNLDTMGRWGQLVFSALVCLLFSGVLVVLLFKPIDLPLGIREVLLVLVGILGGEFKNVGGFWLGTSLSSAKKDAVIARQAASEM